MSTVKIPLSEQEEAHVALIFDVHKAALAHVENIRKQADERQGQLFSPLMRVHGIPDGTQVNVIGRENGAPAFLVYDAPDIPGNTVAGGSSQESVKSTDANASRGA